MSYFKPKALGTPASGDLQNCTAATDSAKGVVELATNAEVVAGADTSRAITPAGLDFIVTCTTRTKEEQTELVKKGFSKTMNSRHLTGEAFDIAVVKDGKLSWKNRDYEPYGDIGMSIGLVWGGNFKGFKDSVHFEYRHE